MSRAPSQGVRVRRAEVEDAERIAEFNRAMARETEGKDLEVGRLRAGVEAPFAEPRRGLYYVAESDGRIVGSLLITYEWSDWRNGDFWWIQSVYVEPESRRCGVFRALYEHVEERARSRDDVCGLRLYVERDNERAQAVYRAVGMTESVYRLFEVDLVL
ncbi:MAG: GNAT family N-acetyltransferase [Planctomycetota bacterium]|jgi:GNAT superfamily N-acetyltransferase